MPKKIRIAMCGIHEEVNAFVVESMGFATVTGNMSTGFQRFEGQALIDEYKGTSTWPGGWVDAFLEQPEVEFIPLAFYNYTDGPTIQGEAHQEMKKDVLDTLKAAMPLDGVGIQMHGAGVAEGVDDIEGDLYAAIRELVGADVKLACALVHHCNLTDQIIDCDPPGIGSNDLTTFTYEKKTKKLYPLDQDAVYS